MAVSSREGGTTIPYVARAGCLGRAGKVLRGATNAEKPTAGALRGQGRPRRWLGVGAAVRRREDALAGPGLEGGGGV